jgi:hypothetical protein
MVRANLSTFPFAPILWSPTEAFLQCPKCLELPVNIWFEPHDFVWEHNTWEGAYYDEAQNSISPN